MAAWDNAPLKTVILHKTHSDGKLPLGRVFTWTYKTALTPLEAVSRARKRFQGEHPNENPVNWTVMDG